MEVTQETLEAEEEAMRVRLALVALVDAIEVSTQPNKRGHRVHVALRNARAALAGSD